MPRPAVLDGAPHSPAAPSADRYATYALLVLTLANAVAYVDRQIMAVLLQPIKVDLGLSDTQLGFLSGVTFAVFYATLGVPIAMLADRSNRRNIIAGALTLFSAMTAACGLAPGFWQLALARVFVGVGEAGAGPPTHSVIADLFPRERRATALGVYGVGINIGILIGFLVGGWVAELHGWRLAFIVVGAPGLLVALLVRLTIREPVRGQSDGVTDSGVNASLGVVVRRLWGRAAYRHLVIGASLYSLLGFALLTWTPAFLARSFAMSPGEIGTALALILGFAGAIGTFSSAFAADRLGGRDVRWNLWAPAVLLLVMAAGTAAMLLSESRTAALLFFIIPAMTTAAHVGPGTAMIQALAPVRMRVAASALMLFVVHLLGMGGGPQLVGVLSDLYAPRFGPEALRYALLTSLLVAPWGTLHFVLAARSLKADIAMASRGA